ncbi:MAG: succinate dehydrogenase iron-sulfur subunit [Myxococcota bacterium]
MTERSILLRIRRQKGPNSEPYWQEFRIPYRPNMNIISCLQDIQKNPVTSSGDETTPVVWESNCLEEVCGACAMVINGKPRQACSTLVDKLEQPIELKPLSKFALIRDLMVDRQPMFEALKRVKAWTPIDGLYDLGAGPKVDMNQALEAYDLSRCMTCGNCMEACPQYNVRSEFIGPAPISQARLFNMHPTGKVLKRERLKALMGPDGISECGNAQNCVEACPKEIPLTTSIAQIARDTTLEGVFGWLRREK